MATSYKDLIQQRQDLDRQIEEARKTELSGAISQVRDLIAEYGLSAQDVFPAGNGRRASGTKVGGKVAPKYRHPETGATWTGRGKAPRWIEGQDRSQFAIA